MPEPTKIDPGVPLAQQHNGRRVVQLNVGIADDGWTEDAKKLGWKPPEIDKPDGGSPPRIDAVEYARRFRETLKVQGARIVDLVGIDQTINELARQPAEKLEWTAINEVLTKPKPGVFFPNRGALGDLGGTPPIFPRLDPRIFTGLRTSIGTVASGPLASAVNAPAVAAATPAAAAAPPPVARDDSTPTEPTPVPLTIWPGVPELSDALVALFKGKYLLPQYKMGRNIELVPFKPLPQTRPAIFLIEEYAITSMLGDFGLGRTSRVFSLFPGETTEIVMKTWRSDEQTVSRASSIVDSYSSASADRFNSELEKNAGSSMSLDVGSSYSNEWHAGGGFSFIVSVEGGGGESRSSHANLSQSQFANQTAKTVREHTAEANASRQTTVSDSSELTAKAGEELTTTRTLRNVNMKHTLNIVFRELNQEYTTNVHLVGLKVGFQNGQLGSWREAPLPQLRPFLSQFVKADRLDAACSKILGLAAVILDHNDTPVPVLDKIEWSADGRSVDIKPAEVAADGTFPPPTDNLMYRFRPGTLGGQDDVNGVILAQTTVVMATDSVVAEALMGTGEALDDYAMQRQAADTEAAVLANKATEVATSRAQLVVDALKDVQDSTARMKSYAEAFRPIVVDGDEVSIDGG